MSPARIRQGPFLLGIVAVVVLCFFSLRVSTVLLAATSVSFYLFYHSQSSERWLALATLACILSLITFLSPIDLGWDGYPGPVCGHRRSGPRLVRLAMGCLPMHHKLVEAYGEYMPGNRVGSGLEPKWIFVLK